jgi:hypothetical protein
MRGYEREYEHPMTPKTGKQLGIAKWHNHEPKRSWLSNFWGRVRALFSGRK